MSKWEFVQLKEVLRHQKGNVRSLLIDDATEYKLCRVQVHRKGVVLRKKQFGHEIKTKKQQLCHTGDLIVAEMDAKFGGYGFIPPDLEGSVVSSHYYLYELDYSKITQEYLEVLINTDYIQNQIEAKGSTNYSSIRAWEFLEYTIPLPSLKEQRSISKQFRTFADFKNKLSVELNKQEKYVSQLKQAILQEAIAGQLTAEWRTENPMQKGNSDTDAAALLATIKAEKQQLIADGKLKKENILPEISPDKIPFILPNTWVWCPLGEVTHFIDYRGKTPTKITSGIRLITAKNVKQGYLSLSPDEYISEQEYEERMTRGYPQLGDVFFTTEAPLGNACLNNLDEPISMGQRIITIRSIAFLSSYLLKVILSPAIQKEIDIRKTGVTAQGIKSKRLVEVHFPLPPLAEQKAIVEKVDKLMNIIDRLEQQIKHRKQLAEDLMQTVLREAFE